MFIRTSLVPLTSLAILILLSAKSFAETKSANFGGPDAVPNQLAEDQRQDTPLKDQWAEKGLQVSLDYSAVVLRANESLAGSDDDSAGGMLRFYGSWDLYNQGSKNTGTLIWKVEHRHDYTDTAPKDFLFGTGVLGLETPPFSDQGARMTNLYWSQHFNDGRTTVNAGLLDVTDYLDVYALASPWTGFYNFAFSTGTTTVALPGDAAFGVAGGTMIGDNFFAIAGVTDMNSDPTRPHETLDNFFSDNKYFKSVELGWTSGQENIYTDNIHLTYWHADESEVQGSTEGDGVNFSASKLINGKWLPFLRAGYSDGAGTLAEKSVSTGVGYMGLGSPKNTLGFGVNWADVPGSEDQYTAELYYIMKPFEQFEITPDIQYIQNPALDPGESSNWVVGLRGRFVL